MKTYAQLRDEFNESIRPAVLAQYAESDIVAMREAWNTFTDQEAKDGQLTDMEYHYCPAIDSDDGQWPDDDEDMLELMLEEIGVSMSARWIPSRTDGLMSDWTMIHWECGLSRGTYSMTVYFSQGVAHHPLYRNTTGATVAIVEDLEKRRDGRGLTPPTAADVICSLLLDTSGDLDDFTSWCADLGYDDDSIQALRTFEQIREHDRQLGHLIGDWRDSLAERAGEV